MSIEEALDIASSIDAELLRGGQPPRYALKDPHEVVEEALKSGNVSLLRCYQISYAAGCGLVGAHFIFPEMTARGYVEIEPFITKWRIDLRREVLSVMQNIPGVMNENGIPESAIDCMVMAYAARDENEGRGIAALIQDRSITDPSELTSVINSLKDHHGAISHGFL